MDNTSFLNNECGVLLRNRWNRILAGKPSVLDFLVLALSKMVEENQGYLETLIGSRNGSLGGLILLLDLKKVDKVPVA